jgi:hypothetical protein
MMLVRPTLATALLLAGLLAGCMGHPAPAKHQAETRTSPTTAPGTDTQEPPVAAPTTRTGTASSAPQAPRRPADPPLLAIGVRVERNVAHLNISLQPPGPLHAAHWEFGDGTSGNRTAPSHAYASLGRFQVEVRALADDGPLRATATVDILEVPFRPHVVVAIADSGINPYHAIYFRPNLTAHPCTYLVGYPCDVPALNLSVGRYATWEEAFNADKRLWEGIQLHQWYWIPRTNIIAAVCTNPEGGGPGSLVAEASICILDDSEDHGTGTTSSMLMEAPDALLMFAESNAGADDLASPPILPDIQSHSWGPPAPLPLQALDVATGDAETCATGHHDARTLFFQAAGNEFLFPAPADSSRFCPSSLVVGGGTSQEGEVGSWTLYDFASWYCRPGAKTKTLDETEPTYCGTSFAAPTAAGAAAEALYRIRLAEGYLGGNTLDHVAGNVTREAFLHALRWAATYHPQPTYSDTSGYAPLPLVPGAEWLTWGWGFLDQQVVPTIVACATSGPCPEKDANAVAWNEARQQAREAPFL